VSGGTPCPLDLVFALDVSGSMTQAEMELLEKAIATFKEHLSGQRPRVTVISFGMRVKIVAVIYGGPNKIEKAFAGDRPR